MKTETLIIKKNIPFYNVGQKVKMRNPDDAIKSGIAERIVIEKEFPSLAVDIIDLIEECESLESLLELKQFETDERVTVSRAYSEKKEELENL